jgi:hypothetical protein
LVSRCFSPQTFDFASKCHRYFTVATFLQKSSWGSTQSLAVLCWKETRRTNHLGLPPGLNRFGSLSAMTASTRRYFIFLGRFNFSKALPNTLGLSNPYER